MNIVKELRKRNGIQQKELAIDVGVSQPTISDWEHNKKDPSGDRLKRLAEIFGVDPGVILGYGNPFTMDRQSEDADVMEIREQLRRDPNTRLLFGAIRKAKPEHVRAALAVLQSFEPPEEEP